MGTQEQVYSSLQGFFLRFVRYFETQRLGEREIEKWVGKSADEDTEVSEAWELDFVSLYERRYSEYHI